MHGHPQRIRHMIQKNKHSLNLGMVAIPRASVILTSQKPVVAKRKGTAPPEFLSPTPQKQQSPLTFSTTKTLVNALQNNQKDSFLVFYLALTIASFTQNFSSSHA